jgi:hypothetical protein
MHNGTKLGLILIGLAFLAASTAVSAHYLAKALDRTRGEFPPPALLRECMPADAGKAPETASAGASRHVGDAKA